MSRMSIGAATGTGSGLWPWSVFAAVLAAAGLPIYLHAPKFFGDTYGVSLAALGVTLAALRLIDVVQDPLLGWLAGAMRRYQGAMVSVAMVLMAAAMFGLFAVPPLLSPLVWFAVTLTVLFTAFSYLTIVFYAIGVARAGALGPNGHVRLAGWRETGGLVGVCVAAVAPVALAGTMQHPFTGFAIGFALMAGVATWAMRHEWQAGPGVVKTSGLAGLKLALKDGVARNLLLVALFNGAPVAVTSTLFLYFVESRLAAPEYAGAFLLLFFLSAAMSTPVWARLAQAFGAKRVLLAAMALSIASFVFAATLGTGALIGFAVICVASGAALGADLTLLPALFARRLAALDRQGAEPAAFGLWSFVSKLSLALAALVLLPVLDSAGFRSGQDNTQSALQVLSWLYALVPCALKLVALLVLALTNVEES